MTKIGWLGVFGVVLFAATSSKSKSDAQAPAQPNTQTVTPTLPATLQLKKTIVFLRTDCLHDFSVEAGAITKERLMQMPLQQEVNVVQQLMKLTSGLRDVKPSVAKLNAEDLAYFNQNSPLGNTPDDIATEGAWRASILIKMTSLDAAEIAGLTPKELSQLPTDTHEGTGFFVGVIDNRVSLPGDADKHLLKGFTYLVTNRHMVQPGIEVGKPCQVIGAYIMLNRKADSTHPTSYSETSNIPNSVQWTYSTDDSVDLAVAPFMPPQTLYDYIVIPTTQFITDEEVKSNRVVEGDPVLFSGLFIQSFNELHTLEPIVRSGTLAMIPNGLLETTLNKKQGHIYLAEAHAFGGNSGSPIFIDTNKFANVIGGPSYQLLGVISGEVLENSDLTLNVTTSLTANVGANSDVSMVVPAHELLGVLNEPKLSGERDAVIAKQPAP
jgi:hypothetical protein